MMAIEMHAMQGDRSTHVLTTHRREADEGPLQLISAKQLAYLQRIEKMYIEILEMLAKADLGQP